MTLLYLWGKGGYYVLWRYPDGSISVPEGANYWLRLGRYAPYSVIWQVNGAVREDGRISDD